MKHAPALVTAAAAAAFSSSAVAQDLSVSVEVPRLGAAEYHAPYVAIWIERPDQTAMNTLAVWYDVAARNNEGLTWLADMRTWWRRIGRTMTLPADGVSGATRAPGRHTLRASAQTLRGLAPGEYTLVVEAARELGGREVVRVPFNWNGQAQTASARGATELGEVTVAITR